MDRRAFYEQRAGYRPAEAHRYYQRLLRRYYSFAVPPGSSVMEVGCGLGDLLAAVNPKQGVGIDFSPSIINLARARHPQLHFEVAEASAIKMDGAFEYILLSDLINDLPDVQEVFEKLHQVSTSKTRLVLNFFSNLWRPILHGAEVCGFKAPTVAQNWLSADDTRNLLYLAGWEVVKTQPRILWPVRTPLLGPLLNRWVAPPLAPLCLTVMMVARPLARRQESPKRDYSCSVIIPARNESGNIDAAVTRTPEMGAGTEIIIIEGHSTDDTWAEIQRVAAKYPARKIKILKQESKGKGGAVREAFAAAAGELLFILDADLTVPPEELPKFYEAARTSRGEFVNGVRLVYPMENEAMQFLNMIANKLFGLAFSWLLGQKIKDTLCGTKVLWRDDYQEIARNRSYFGEFDPFGDFDLLFGAAKLNRRIVDLPIRYKARTYGETNIHRWRHGWLLLRMVLVAARRLKFIA